MARGEGIDGAEKRRGALGDPNAGRWAGQRQYFDSIELYFPFVAGLVHSRGIRENPIVVALQIFEVEIHRLKIGEIGEQRSVRDDDRFIFDGVGYLGGDSPCNGVSARIAEPLRAEDHLVVDGRLPSKGVTVEGVAPAIVCPFLLRLDCASDAVFLLNSANVVTKREHLVLFGQD